MMRNDPTVVNLEISWAIDPDRLSIDPFAVFSRKGLGWRLVHALIRRSAWATDHGFRDSLMGGRVSCSVGMEV